MKNIVPFLFVMALANCAEQTPFQIAQSLLGYTPPPEETTIAEELRLEFKRCEKTDPDRNCAQIAYDVVRRVKGLEPRKVPEGVVIILEGNVKIENEDKLKRP